jgi:quinol monooxygenase YgiN
MIDLVVRMRVEEGMEEEFSALISNLAKQVRALEPGCTRYAPQQVLTSPREFFILCSFKSWEDYEIHGDMPHCRAALPDLQRMLDGPPVFEVRYGAPRTATPPTAAA